MAVAATLSDSGRWRRWGLGALFPTQVGGHNGQFRMFGSVLVQCRLFATTGWTGPSTLHKITARVSTFGGGGGMMNTSGDAQTQSEYVALVTGASRGVGRGVALALADSGLTVYVTGRNIAQPDLPNNILRISCDHTDDAQVR